nr:uncharacterized protein LOC127340782 [Lolium perenne]XP_051222495.1 uncharacterized protein LOC127340782 [Lolium perenne]
MQGRGSIAFFSTYRPPVPLDIFSSTIPGSPAGKELLLTDGVSYNYDCRPIPPAALKELLTWLGKNNAKLARDCGATPDDADKGRVTGLIFVSERDNGLETLHVSLRTNNQVKVYRLADIYGADTFGGVRMEDGGCIAGGFKVGPRTVGHSLVYVSTKEPAKTRRTPWTVVYKTNLADGKTQRLTPQGQYDLSPAVSPSGTMVAVASFADSKWNGEIENLKTNIVVMNVDGDLGRRLLIKDGGWPTWGSDSVIFFHRGVNTTLRDGTVQTAWGVFRYDMTTRVTVRVTPAAFNCMTPAAISSTKVAVATIRKRSGFSDVRDEAQYRHIEIYDTAMPGQVIEVTRRGTNPKADHYNPFVDDGGKRIGYHRCRTSQAPDEPTRRVDKLQSPGKDVGLFRVSGVFPTISKDGTKLAFVDNEFSAVWLVDKQSPPRKVYETGGPDRIFSPVWNQNLLLDSLYVCMGPSFHPDNALEICNIPGVSGTFGVQGSLQLTQGGFNNAFPSSNPQGNKFVFRSTRDGGTNKYKNLYIMDNSVVGANGLGKVTRLTNGPWTDTHCQWSPSGDWIVFSSTRDKPATAPPKDFGLDPGYFAVYLVKANDPTVVVRVMRSGSDLSGHVNHPVFSPDCRSITVTSDLAAVSVDPISLPLFVHSVRPYGDIFLIDIDNKDITKNKDVQSYKRITHSRYENSTPCWTVLSPDDPRAPWTTMAGKGPAAAFRPGCPYAESFKMTGHLIVPKRCC